MAANIVTDQLYILITRGKTPENTVFLGFSVFYKARHGVFMHV
jgi:hypothetical protein